MNNFKLCFVTLSVNRLAEAERFYVDVLGFHVTRRYEATRWISLSVDEIGGGFGLIESDSGRPPPDSTVDFFVTGLDGYWQGIKEKVEILSPPIRTPWGSYKAVIRDPFGNRLGFVESTDEEAAS